jgi:radical SAM superfamily enzyme YgiQ (UPF0313 family)
VKVLLVNPTQDLALDSEAGSAVEEGSGHYPPLGLLHLQAAVEAGGRHSVDVVDACAGASLEQSLTGMGGGEAPSLVGITALTPNLLSVVHTVDQVKQVLPEARVVIGGPHVDLFPLETARLEGVDYALAGEAETTLPMLVDGLGKGQSEPSVPGLYTAAGEVDSDRVGPCWAEDLDAMPVPDRSRIDVTAYRGIAGSDEVFTTMITSRGCPYRCTFCSTPRSSYRMRSVDAVIDEMERCGRLGVGHVYFLDDTFPTSGERAEALGETLARRSDLPQWSCRTAAAGLTEERLKVMKRGGCQRVQIGVETCTDEGLKALGKRTTIDQIVATFSAAQRVGMTTVAYFMLGLPTETSVADIRHLMSFARELGPTFAMFNVLTLYPGTALYAQAAEKGLVKGDEWQRFAAAPGPGFVQPVWEEFFSRSELDDLQNRVYRSFYLRPSKVLQLALSGGGLGRKVRAGLSLLLEPLRRRA